jgi:hypothetical protein
MVTAQPRAPARAAGWYEEPSRTPAVSSGEILVLAAALGVALLGWSGLALADLGHYGVGLAVGLALLAVLIVAALAWRMGWPAFVLDPAGLVMLAGLVLVAGALFFPGFPYGAGDKDPGAYVNHAIQIARHGSIRWTDPALERVKDVSLVSPGAQRPAIPGALWPALWLNAPGSAVISPQFYHLWPALLASAFSVGGYSGLVNVTPLVGVLAVLALALAVRRVFGLLAGSLAGLLLATNMLQVWQARYPTTEMLTQLFVIGSLLGLLIALQSGWGLAAGIAGLLLGASFLTRPDGLLLVLLAVATGLVLLALRRFDRCAGWFAAGLALTLPHALLQAYGIAERYTLANDVPPLRTVALVVLAGLAAALLARWLLPGLCGRVVALLEDRRAQRWGGVAILAAAAGLLLVGFLRPRLFGADYLPGPAGVPRRSYDEQSLWRLSWFFTMPGMGVMLLGLALVALRRWRAAAWALVVPVLLLLPLYAWHARNSVRLMWWGRRFVPVVVPGMVLLIAVALAAGLTWAAASGRWRWGRWPVRATSAGVAGFLLLVFLSQSLPLRHHQELAGSFELTQRIARAAHGRQGVFLWEHIGKGITTSPGYLFGGPLIEQEGQISALLPQQQVNVAYVREFARTFPGQPVFVLWRGRQPPPADASLGLERVDHIVLRLPMWQESNDRRPSHAKEFALDFSIWHVSGT